jgi:chemotaxis protein methyltransferase WspC
VGSLLFIRDRPKARQAADAGRLDEAAALCAALADQRPPRADVFCLLGVVRQAQGDFAEAERCFQRALYLDPQHGDALLHAALLARRRGDERLAENYLRRRG